MIDHDALARVDMQHHIEHGVSLCPFSTAGARSLWTLGFEGQALPWSVNHASIYAQAYFRGQAAAKLTKEQTV